MCAPLTSSLLGGSPIRRAWKVWRLVWGEQIELAGSNFNVASLRRAVKEERDLKVHRSGTLEAASRGYAT